MFYSDILGLKIFLLLMTFFLNDVFLPLMTRKLMTYIFLFTKHWKNCASSEKAVTTGKTLTELPWEAAQQGPPTLPTLSREFG